MPLAVDVTLDSTTWAALALVLTILGGAFTLGRLAAARSGRRRARPAWTLIPVAAWLTGTLKLAANVVDAVISWARPARVLPARVARHHRGRGRRRAVR